MRSAVDGFCAVIVIFLTFVSVYVMTKPNEPEVHSLSQIASTSGQPTRLSSQYNDNSDVTAEWARISQEQALEDLQEQAEDLREESESSHYAARAAQSDLDSKLQDLEFDHFDEKRRLRQRFEQIDRDAERRRQESDAEFEVMRKKWEED